MGRKSKLQQYTEITNSNNFNSTEILKIDEVVEKTANRLFIKYHSLNNLITALKEWQHPNQEKPRNERRIDFPDITCNKDFDFMGINHYTEAIDLALNGWKEGIDKAANIIDSILPELESRLPESTLYYSDEGAVMDIQAFINGEPEYWINQCEVLKENTEKANRGFIKIAINGTASSGIDKDTMIARGIVIFAIVSLLETMGYQCIIDLEYSQNSGEFECHVRLKNAGDTLDMAQLVYAIAHPSMFRSNILRVMAGCHFAGLLPYSVNHWQGHGSPSNGLLKNDCDLYFNKISFYDKDKYSNNAKIMATIQEMLKSQGIELTAKK